MSDRRNQSPDQIQEVQQKDLLSAVVVKQTGVVVGKQGCWGSSGGREAGVGQIRADEGVVQVVGRVEVGGRRGSEPGRRRRRRGSRANGDCSGRGYWDTDKDSNFQTQSEVGNRETQANKSRGLIKFENQVIKQKQSQNRTEQSKQNRELGYTWKSINRRFTQQYRWPSKTTTTCGWQSKYVHSTWDDWLAVYVHNSTYRELIHNTHIQYMKSY